MLLDELLRLSTSDEYPMHMPGHKRQNTGSALDGAYAVDITEIEGYDNLYDAQGILADAMSYASECYDCPNTFYLVNGATGGIHVAIRTVASMYENNHQGKKGRILIASNCHRSVKAAAELSGLDIDVMEIGRLEGINIFAAVSPTVVENKLLSASSAGLTYAAVVITSPTYEGIISDIEAIANVCHRYDTMLIVDEAHGAHFDLSDKYPSGALKYGADIVIHSTHKTLAAMTQTALLHAQGNMVDITMLKKYWTMLQTSSPSYVLMASIDLSLHHIKENPELIDKHLLMVKDMQNKLADLKNMHLLVLKDTASDSDITALDPYKITVITKSDIDGYTLQRILLDDYHIQLEMASESYILGITTYSDTQEGLERFTDALLEIDDRISQKYYNNNTTLKFQSHRGSRTDKSDLYAPCIPR